MAAAERTSNRLHGRDDGSHGRRVADCCGVTVLSWVQEMRAERRYRIARPARTNGGPIPWERQACIVREDILRRSAACTSVSNFSSSTPQLGIAIVPGCTMARQ